MFKRSITFLLLSAMVGVPMAVGASDDACAVPGAVLCDGQRVLSLTPFVPLAAPSVALDANLTPPAATAALVTTCRYKTTTHAAGKAGPQNGPFQFSKFAVDEELGAYSIARAFSSGIKKQQYSTWAYGEAGVTVLLRNWPQPSSVMVTYPWHVIGELDANADVKNTSATAKVDVDLVLKQADLPSSTRVVQEDLTSIFGPQTQNVNRSGTNSLTVSTPSNLTYKGFLRVRSEATSQSGWGFDAAALSNFFPNRGGTGMDHEDWKFNLPPGWTITNCGGGVPIK